MQTLQNASRHPPVKLVQRLWNRRTIQTYQQANNFMERDRIIGPDTWTQLLVPVRARSRATPR